VTQFLDLSNLSKFYGNVKQNHKYQICQANKFCKVLANGPIKAWARHKPRCLWMQCMYIGNGWRHSWKWNKSAYRGDLVQNVCKPRCCEWMVPHHWTNWQQKHRPSRDWPATRQHVGVDSLPQCHWNGRQVPSTHQQQRTTIKNCDKLQENYDKELWLNYQRITIKNCDRLRENYDKELLW